MLSLLRSLADLMAGIDLTPPNWKLSGKPDAELPDGKQWWLEAKKGGRRNSVYFSRFDPLKRRFQLTGALLRQRRRTAVLQTIAGFVGGQSVAQRRGRDRLGRSVPGTAGRPLRRRWRHARGRTRILVKRRKQGLSAEEARVNPLPRWRSAQLLHGDGQFRAGRMLWANIAKRLHGRLRHKMFTHAVTSGWNITAHRPH